MPCIKLNPPPSPQTYDFTLNLESVQNPPASRISLVESTLGDQIGKCSPEQKVKIASITAAAVSIICGVGCLIAGTMLSITPLCFAAIPLFLAAGGLLYCASKQVGREKAMERIAQATLAEISKQYTPDNIVCYRLLDRLIPKDCDSNQQTLFYARFEELQQEFYRFNRAYGKKKEQLVTTWSEETLPLDTWFTKQKADIQQQLDYTRARIHAAEGHLRFGLKAFSLQTLTFYEEAETDLHHRFAEIGRLYGKKIRPWNDWLEQERRALGNAYAQANASLEDQFSWIKSTCKTH